MTKYGTSEKDKEHYKKINKQIKKGRNEHGFVRQNWHMPFLGKKSSVLRLYSGVLELELHELELHVIFFFFLFTYNVSS